MLFTHPDPESRPPPRDRCVLPAMLDRQVRDMPDKTLVVFDDGQAWSYAETRRQARRAAAALARLGVRRGDAVLAWLPAGADILRIHLGLAYLGAVLVPVNTALRGGTLAHVIADSGARLMICHGDLLPRLADVALAAVESLVVVGSGPAVALPPRRLAAEALESADEAFPEPDPPVEPWDTHGIFYTSGTTGSSKGVVCPHLHTTVMGVIAMRFFKQDDRFLVNLPYHHLGGALVPHAVIALGASMAILREFRTRTFWDDVRRTGSTCCFILGAMSTFLMKQPPRPDDADNPLRAVIQQPLMQDVPAFARRFGVDVYTQFDMTEVGPTIFAGPVPSDRRMPHGYCGKAQNVWPRFDLRLLGSADCEVPAGAAGELAIRCDMPWVVTPSYHGNAAATATAWRNGWFHTGDLFRRDADGNYVFVDRIKDSIRRRGENISSAELEAEVLRYEPVADAAAVAVRDPLGEEEVLLAAAPKPGHVIDPRTLVEFLLPRLPHFMVPRYVRVLDRLPYTETSKVQKSRLRAEGITSDAWDREQAGIQVRRERIGAAARGDPRLPPVASPRPEKNPGV